MSIALLASSARAEEPRDSSAEQGDSASPTPAAQWGKGPFEVYDPFVLGELRASPYARSPRPLGPLEIELGVRSVWANSFALADDRDLTDPATGSPLHRLTLDAETRSLDLVARVGLIGRFELGAELRALHWRGGGITDGAIRQYHRTVGFGALGRDQRPNDRYLVTGFEPSGARISFDGHGTALGDAAVSVRGLALEGGDYHPAVALGIRLWIPTASPILEHAHGIADTLSIDASKRLFDLPIFVYVGAAYTYYDQAAVSGLHLTRHRGMYYVGIEWAITSSVSVVAHFWQETRRERKLYRNTSIPYGNFITYVAAGVKVEPIDGLTLELGFLENTVDPNTTADIGLLVNAWFRFGLGSARS